MERKKAIAIRYDQGKDKAPMVVAKGVGELAEKIIETARKHGVPVLEDKALISALMKVEIYEEIPPELYRAVAKVLVFIKAVKSSS
ncbi:EscU/YscU/HrcU family type III secretion system export apparatus switch protein [Pampinifervens florentissimum]|uniref:EscU/YscU/HrcU family type III secretion system export apparatus switch protein n=1 Tax=Pampinifervens florentissimum TaxID=1632019 RepID=UPI0013B489B2|nr:EscU/YscU/HrcU family type III secretion system export apparatus switch protein [Hydrogenobacter sp. T-8]QID33373.1 EscU/YscU/HrcU family type III secretion system export apparatus switch protein [Hydrogenobacter sp. T-8]